MKLKKIWIGIFSLILTVGCKGGFKVQKIQPGKTTEIDLITKKGEPESKSESQDGSKSLNYPDNTSYQISKGVVTGVFRKPEGEEAHLQYWHQLWKSEKTEWSKIKAKSHGAPYYQLKSRNSKMTVVYDSGTNSVIEIVKWGGSDEK